ncbi:hypothetical protein ACWFNE_15030 [Cellulomonas sp. NPDC055163]
MSGAASVLAPIVADALGVLTGLPATVAAAVYSGPPAAPAVLVRAVGAQQVDHVEGTVSGRVAVAVYGGTLDVAQLVEDGRGWVKPEHRETPSGTLVQIGAGDPDVTTLPTGAEVASQVLHVTGYAPLPALTLTPDALPMEAHGVLSGIARGVTERFGAGRVQFGTATAQRANATMSEPGRVVVTGEVAAFPVSGRRIGDYDVQGMVTAAIAALVGTPCGLGRIATARVVSVNGQQDGRSAGVLAGVEVVAHHQPA